ncbi:MAG: tetratricopeptide repeat protein [Bacteroidales bacterium]|nr:tetratricopeptide repeat protein [Bacteroidales bacterium]
MKKGKYTKGNIISHKEIVDNNIQSDHLSQPLNEDSFIKKHWSIFATIIITIFVYSFNFGNQPTNWDDDKYIDANPLLKDFSIETFKKMFLSKDNGERYFMGNYHPLTMLTLNIDYHYSEIGSNGKALPERFIAVNILLHLLSVIFIYLICNQLFKKRLYSIIIPILFAIHTLHVESVTWISERKDVLYTMFYFASLYMYILYKKRTKVLLYITSILLFILSCFSKGQAVSLTISIILIDYFLTEDYLKLKTHINKIPFIIISLIFGLISIEAQKVSTALSEVDQYQFYQRIAFGSYGFVQYVLRLILPLKLSCLYPYPDIINRTVPTLYWLAVPLFIGSILLSVFTYKKHKTLTFGILFFVSNIALLLQFIPVGSAMFADRYSYIPSFGISVLLSLLVDYLLNIKNISKNILISAFSLYILLLCVLTIDRIGVWRNSRTLWTDCVSKYPEAVIGWNNLGSNVNMLADSLYKKTNPQKYVEEKKYAIECFTNGIKYKPDYVHCFYNRGLANKDLFDITSDTTYEKLSLDDYTKAIKFDLNFSNAFQNRAIIYDSYGERWLGVNQDSANYYFNLAITDFNRALDLKPDFWEVYINRGASYGKSGRLEQSLEDLNVYLEHDSSNASAYSNRGLALSIVGDYEKSLKDFERAIQLDSTMEGAYYNQALTYRSMGNYPKAIESLTHLLKINPSNGQAYYYRGVYKYLINQKTEACDDFYTALNNKYMQAEEQIKKFCNQ